MQCQTSINKSSVKLKSKNLVPPGGWYFEQGRYRIQGQTFGELANNVTAHRASNGIEIGDVESEIEAYTSQRWPSGRRLPNMVPVQTRPGFWANVSDFGRAMLKLAIGKDGLVSQSEANRRAAICAQCHNNSERSGPWVACTSCQDKTISAIRTKILKGMTTTSDAVLRACQICGCDGRLQVWFPLSALKMDDSNRNAYPTFCWRRDQ